MIVGIGTDIVAVERMAQSLQRHNGRIAEKILSAAELLEFELHSEAMRPRFLAKRFAAKEAAAKALGTGFRSGIALPQIEVGHDEVGKPQLQWYANAKKQFDKMQATDAHLSISDEQTHAIAFVILERV